MSFDAEVLALAGMCQAARLTLDLARTGRCEAGPQAASLATVYELDPDSAAAVYGDLRAHALGLATLAGLAEGRYVDPSLTRTLIAVMRVERALAARPAVGEAIANGLRAQRAAGAPGSMNLDELTSRLAALYTETVSTLPERIIVQGHGAHLANPAVAAGIRALLFAALRSAVLWRQSGGGRLKLFFYRRRYAERARAHLRALNIPENDWPMPAA